MNTFHGDFFECIDGERRLIFLPPSSKSECLREREDVSRFALHAPRESHLYYLISVRASQPMMKNDRIGKSSI